MSVPTYNCPYCAAEIGREDAFCPKCGKRLTMRTAAEYIASMPPVGGSPEERVPASDARTAITLAGLAWIVVALVGGYLAYLQLDAARIVESTGTLLGTADEVAAMIDSYQRFALINGAGAAVTLVFGALLLTSPTPGRLTASVFWAVVSVIGGILQVSGAETHWTVFAGLAGAAVAGVLSWTGRASLRDVTAR